MNYCKCNNAFIYAKCKKISDGNVRYRWASHAILCFVATNTHHFEKAETLVLL